MATVVANKIVLIFCVFEGNNFLDVCRFEDLTMTSEISTQTSRKTSSASTDSLEQFVRNV